MLYWNAVKPNGFQRLVQSGCLKTYISSKEKAHETAFMPDNINWGCNNSFTEGRGLKLYQGLYHVNQY